MYRIRLEKWPEDYWEDGAFDRVIKTEYMVTDEMTKDNILGEKETLMFMFDKMYEELKHYEYEGNRE